MRLVDKWLSISGLRKVLGANGAEDFPQVVDYQLVGGQHGCAALGLRLRRGVAPGIRGPRDQRPRETLQDIHALLADFFKFVFHADNKLLDAGVVGFGAGGVDFAAHFLDDEAQLFAGIGL